MARDRMYERPSLIVVAPGHTTREDLRLYVSKLHHHRAAFGGPVHLVVWLTDDTPLPPPDVWSGIERLVRHEATVDRVYIVIESTGFIGATVRAMASGLIRLASRRGAITTHSSLHAVLREVAVALTTAPDQLARELGVGSVPGDDHGSSG